MDHRGCRAEVRIRDRWAVAHPQVSWNAAIPPVEHPTTRRGRLGGTPPVQGNRSGLTRSRPADLRHGVQRAPDVATTPASPLGALRKCWLAGFGILRWPATCPFRILKSGEDEPPRFLGDPFMHAPLFDPPDRTALAIASRPMLPSAQKTASAPGSVSFRGSITRPA